MYTKPLTHVARSARPPSFFTPESLRQDLLSRETVCLSVPVSGDTCPSDVEHYHSLCPLEPVDTTPPGQVSSLGTHHLECLWGYWQCLFEMFSTNRALCAPPPPPPHTHTLTHSHTHTCRKSRGHLVIPQRATDV